MQYKDKVELIELLNEFKRLLPLLEERENLSGHYAKVEKRIEEALTKLMDKDYRYIQAVSSKLLKLQLEEKITFEEYMKLAKRDPE